MLANEPQPEKALPPMVVMSFGRVTEVSDEQSWKTLELMFVTLFGIVISRRERQYAKA